mmetsp:Transcript_58167/g.108906  ORF Transcript_58167/g.108906 Transcript_58167/m.108906 type:complete len:221 (-) Transcript_58167:20-682(-)
MSLATSSLKMKTSLSHWNQKKNPNCRKKRKMISCASCPSSCPSSFFFLSFFFFSFLPFFLFFLFQFLFLFGLLALLGKFLLFPLQPLLFFELGHAKKSFFLLLSESVNVASFWHRRRIKAALALASLLQNLGGVPIHRFQSLEAILLPLIEGALRFLQLSDLLRIVRAVVDRVSGDTPGCFAAHGGRVNHGVSKVSCRNRCLDSQPIARQWPCHISNGRM